MTIKVTYNKCCKPEVVFEPYTLTLEVNNYGDHRAIKYLSMCNMRVPQALYERAKDSYKQGAYYDHAASIRSSTKGFLLTLASAIPKRDED